MEAGGTGPITLEINLGGLYSSGKQHADMMMMNCKYSQYRSLYGCFIPNNAGTDLDKIGSTEVDYLIVWNYT